MGGSASVGSTGAHGSPVRVVVQDIAGDEEWKGIAERCPYATFFHTPLWHRVFEATFPAIKVAARRFRFEDDRVAIFPMIEKSHLFGLSRVYASTPASCYGGGISVDQLEPAHVLAMSRWVLTHCPNLVWRISPFQPQADALAPVATEEDSTELLRLDEFADEDALRKHYEHSVRKQVNKGTRAGLRPAVADSWEEWEAYYAVYQKRLREWGSAAASYYPVTLFRKLFEARGSRVKLWIVLKEGVVVGGNLNFYHGAHCVEWHAAYDSACFSLGVRHFLVHAIINQARIDGYLWYDFNPSNRNEGVRRFKQTFGTTSVPSNMVIRRRGVYRLDSLHKTFRWLRRLRGKPA